MQTPEIEQATPAAGTASKPFRLVDKWQDHLKFNGREPRTLEELAIARADYEHKRRRAEIKALGAKLAQLDAFVPQLAERGIQLHYRNINTWDGGKTLRMPPPVLEQDDKLFAALIALGFREIERKTRPYNDQVTLKHGRSLVVVIDVTKVAAAVQAAGATA